MCGSRNHVLLSAQLKSSLALFVLLVLVAPRNVALCSDLKEEEKVQALREAVLKAQAKAISLNKESNADRDSATVARAYKAMFTHLGLKGLKSLERDADTSIALQAMWETHKKTILRKPTIPGRTDWVFDQAPMKEFLSLFAKRVHSEPPEWWRIALLGGEVFPGLHHAFIGKPVNVPARQKVSFKDEVVIVETAEHSFRVSDAVYGEAYTASSGSKDSVALWGPEQSFFAIPSFRGYPYKVFGLDSKTGEKIWTASVWAARRGFSSGPPDGPPPVEFRRQGDTLIVYGCDSHGMYAEGFDVKTGSCQFRFCTCYWFNFSEEWKLE